MSSSSSSYLPSSAAAVIHAVNVHLPPSFQPFELLLSPHYLLEVVPLAGGGSGGPGSSTTTTIATASGPHAGHSGLHALGSEARRKLLLVGLWEWAGRTFGGRSLVATSVALAASFYIQSVLSSVLAAFPPVHSVLDFKTQAKEFVALPPAEQLAAAKDKCRAGVRAGGQAQAWMMAAYGAFVGAPVKHFMPQIVDWLQSLLPTVTTTTKRRKTVVRALLSYGVQAPVEIGIWLLSMAFISGSRSSSQLKTAVKTGFGPVFRATVVLQTVSLLLARRLGEQTTAKWAAVLQFVMGCIGMTIVKRKARFSRGGAPAGGSFSGGSSGGGYSLWSGSQKSQQQQTGESCAATEGSRGRYPAWQPGVDYKVGDRVHFCGNDYAVQQAHASQGDWQPDSTPNLFGLMEAEFEGTREEQ